MGKQNMNLGYLLHLAFGIPVQEAAMLLLVHFYSSKVRGLWNTFHIQYVS